MVTNNNSYSSLTVYNVCPDLNVEKDLLMYRAKHGLYLQNNSAVYNLGIISQIHL